MSTITITICLATRVVFEVLVVFVMRVKDILMLVRHVEVIVIIIIIVIVVMKEDDITIITIIIINEDIIHHPLL